jgi:hypothetical protein
LSKVIWMRIRRYTIVTLKYLFAVLLALSLALILDIPDYLSACFIAVLTLQPNFYRGIEFSWQQIKGTVVGGVVTVLVVLLSGGVLHGTFWPVQAAVSMAITIGLCLGYRLEEGSIIALFTVAYLTCLPEMIHESFFRTLDLRILTIGVGLFTGLVMNYGSSLFGYRDRLFLNVRELTYRLGDRIEAMADSLEELEEGNARSLRPELKRLRGLRQSLGEVEIDLEEIEFRHPSLEDPPTVEKEGYEDQFNRLYCLKDLSHHLWSLWLSLVKSGTVPRVVRSEFERLPEVYRTMEPWLAGENTDDFSAVDCLERIDERLAQLPASSTKPAVRALRNCYRVLKDECEDLAGDRETGPASDESNG